MENTINLGGTEYPLKLNINGMIEFEEITGVNLMDGFDIKASGMKGIRALVYVCIKNDDTDITIEAVGEMIDLSKMEEISTALAGAFGDAMPQDDDSKN